MYVYLNFLFKKNETVSGIQLQKLIFNMGKSVFYGYIFPSISLSIPMIELSFGMHWIIKLINFHQRLILNKDRIVLG